MVRSSSSLKPLELQRLGVQLLTTLVLNLLQKALLNLRKAIDQATNLQTKDNLRMLSDLTARIHTCSQQNLDSTPRNQAMALLSSHPKPMLLTRGLPARH